MEQGMEHGKKDKFKKMMMSEREMSEMMERMMGKMDSMMKKMDDMMKMMMKGKM